MDSYTIWNPSRTVAGNVLSSVVLSAVPFKEWKRECCTDLVKGSVTFGKAFHLNKGTDNTSTHEMESKCNERLDYVLWSIPSNRRTDTCIK